jgi:hypothetical protein
MTVSRQPSLSNGSDGRGNNFANEFRPYFHTLSSSKAGHHDGDCGFVTQFSFPCGRLSLQSCDAPVRSAYLLHAVVLASRRLTADERDALRYCLLY